MKNLYTLLLSGVFSVSITYSQWSYVNTDEYFADANAVIEDGSGNILIAGGGGSWPFTPEGDVRVTKLSSDGTLIWEYTFTSPASIGAITANDIAEAADGYVIFCSGFEKPLVIKLNTDGTLAWTTEGWCSGLATASLSKAYGMIATDGSITMAGQDGYYTDFNIYKIAADGSLTTSFSYPMSSGFLGYSIVETWEGIGTADGGMAICGGIAVSGTYGPFIWKFDSDGNEEWRSDLIGYGGDAYGITQTSDGGYAIATADNFAYEMMLVKTDDAGTLSWSESYAATSTDYFPYAADVAERTDGSYVMAVNNYDNLYVYYGSADIIFSNSTGAEVSRITIAGGEETTEINSIIATADNGFALCGHFGMDDYMSGAWDSRYYGQKSGADGSLPECIYNCVWPGDADNNGTANSDDFLALGLGYGSTGSARTSTGNDWFAHAASEWATALPDGTNHKYTDCNGDGIIDDNDTSAVSINYAQTHALVSLKTTADAPLYIEDPGIVLIAGPQSLKLRLGDAANVVEDLYGLRFTLQFEGESISPESVSVNFENSWIGAETEFLQFRKLFADTYQIDAAIVRKDLVNADGYGDIGSLSFVLIDNIAGKTTEAEELTFSIVNVRAISADMSEIPIEGLITKVNADATAIENEQKDIVQVYPNPATEDFILLNGFDKIETAQLADISGKIILEFSEAEIHSGKLFISGVSNGIYQLMFKTTEGIQIEKLLIAQP